jgi:hypothetical protein
MARGDWAVYGFVRAGIEARARLERVEEERSQLCLHAKRLVHWIHRRLAVLLQVLGEPDAQDFDNLKTIIIHHYRVIKSLLKADAPLFGPEERAILLTSQRRIVETLDPEKIAETAVEQDNDADTVGSDDDGINREFDEDELGGFIADRLQDEVNEEVERFIAARILEEVDEELGIGEGEGDAMDAEYHNEGVIQDDGMVLDG